MVNTRTDSPTSRRIVLAFLDFLKSVEPAPGVDPEALDVAKDCLEEVFKLNSASSNNGIQPDLLWDLFSSRGGDQQKLRSELGPSTIKNSSCISSTSRNVENSNALKAADSAGDPHELGGVLKDELFGNFYAALDKINFFTTSPGGIEDPDKITKATQLFHDALTEMENSGQKITLSNLAETFKSKGNQVMLLKLYFEAIELYTCAVALCERNAIYYCNRAAAYTQIHRYNEAIEDCLKSIEIDPGYSKAYSRLGSAYFAQGNYSDALNKGYLKALELDPDNSYIRENIRVTEQKVREQHFQEERDERTRPRDPQESRAHSTGPTNDGAPFTSFPPGASTPEFFANMFRSMASGHGQESATQSTGSANGSTPFTSFPINVSMSPEFSNMFGGMASSHGQESTAQSSGSTNQSHAFRFPSEFANMFANVASAPQAHQAYQPHGRTSGGNGEESNERTNVNLNFGEAPEQVSDVLRSVMGMFSSQMASQGGRPQGTDRN